MFAGQGKETYFASLPHDGVQESGKQKQGSGYQG